jgi:hypothetical protein
MNKKLFIIMLTTQVGTMPKTQCGYMTHMTTWFYSQPRPIACRS